MTGMDARTSTTPRRGPEGTAIEGVREHRRTAYPPVMCRSIKTLRRSETATTTGEIEAAARQFVRKVSGYRVPSARNAAVFDAAILEVAEASRRLLESLAVSVEEGPDRWTPRGVAHSHTAGDPAHG